MRLPGKPRSTAVLVGLVLGLSAASCSGGSSRPGWRISGTVSVPGAGSPAGIPIALGGDGHGTVATDAAGGFAFTGLADGTYTITPAVAGYACTPASRTVVLSGADVGGQDFVATTPSCLPACAGTRQYDAIGYALTGHFDWASSQLVASEELTLALAEGAGTVVELDSNVQVANVRAGTLALAYAAGASTLRVDLGPLTPGTSPVTFTIDYTAASASAPGAPKSLWATASSVDDPVRTRVVFTDSEPNRGHNWLVQKDDPSDPARFSVTLTVAADEDVVANGERRSDTVVPDGRRVAYALDAPVATYLMAFAAGQLEHLDWPTGASVPLSLWYRRGLAVDPALTLGAVASAMATFEALLGPYPFSRYAVLLQPLADWGMENATLSVESEDFGQDPFAAWVHGHELAHQWFGDLVTMHGYDDLWVKEGMATLLAAEADRARADLEGRGRLLASSFVFDPGDAILDPGLQGLAKYTTGPYDRAAALITQIRARVGEMAFWAHLRQFLIDHARGSATGEQFVRAFSPDLSEPEIQQVLAILPQAATPTLTASLLDGGARARLTLDDPAHQLLVPYRLAVVDGAGAATSHALSAGVPLELDVPGGGYLAPDEGEQHPDVPVAGGVFEALSSVLQPTPGTPAGGAFAARSASHQERALRFGGLPALTPGEFPGYYAALDSDRATVEALAAACRLVQSLPQAARGPWIDVLAPIFHAPRAARPMREYLACGATLGETFLAELQELADGADVTQLARLEYLLWFEYGAVGRAVVAQVASTAPSLRLRTQAAARLATPPVASLLPVDGAVDGAENPGGPIRATIPWRAPGGAAGAEGKAFRMQTGH